MKEDIKKAIKNGFDYTITNEPQELIEFEGFSKEFMLVFTQDDPPRRSFTIHELVYKTDFIDKLDPRVACGLYKSCVCMGKEIDGEFISICSMSQTPGKSCRHYGLSTMAFHHRREMANMSLEEIKEYIKNMEV